MTTTNAEKLITVIGGAGFAGRHVVRSLAKRGYRVRVACRRPDLAGHVTTQGSPGQIVPVQANVRYPASLAAACEGAYAVINLTAVFHNAGAQSFDAVHVFGADAAAKAAKAAKAQVMIHLSGIGTDQQTESLYVKSRAEGEFKVKAAFPGAIIVRPSIIFGPEDRFFNKFAAMARFSPVLPLVGGSTKYQPVFVGDVAEAVATLVDRGVADGKIYEFGGPEQKTMKELMSYILSQTQRTRLLLPLPFAAAKFMGAMAGLLPNPVLTMDQVELMKSDNTVSTAANVEGRSLIGLGITPRSIESIVPAYLYRYRKAGQFTIPKVAPE